MCKFFLKVIQYQVMFRSSFWLIQNCLTYKFLCCAFSHLFRSVPSLTLSHWKCMDSLAFLSSSFLESSWVCYRKYFFPLISPWSSFYLSLLKSMILWHLIHLIFFSLSLSLISPTPQIAFCLSKSSLLLLYILFAFSWSSFVFPALSFVPKLHF